MGKTIHNMLKTGLLYGAIGAVLAVAAPYLAAAVGIEAVSLGAMTNPAWLGVFFGGMGVLDAAIRPAFDWIFGDGKKQEEQNNPQIIIQTPNQQLVKLPDLVQSPEQKKQIIYTQKITDERNNPSHKFIG